MLHSEFDNLQKIDTEVQTSLEYLLSDTREEVQVELHKLREDKSLLEGKIRGYLTLSDICREYKEELSKLRQEYNKLLQKVNSCNSQKMGLENHRSESPTSEKDTGPAYGHDSGKHSPPHDVYTHQSSSSPTRDTRSSFQDLVLERESPIRTKELFDQVEDHKKSSEGHKSMPHSFNSKLSYPDKFPMQESMAEESNQSVTGLGFEQVANDDLAIGLSAGQMRQAGDLIKFSYPQGRPPPGAAMKQPVPSADVQDLENIEQIVKSINLESIGEKDLNKVVAAVKSYAEKQLQAANRILVDRNNEYQRKIHTVEDDNRRLLEKIKQLEKQIYDLSLSRSGSPQAKGWVHVEIPAKAENLQMTADVHEKVMISSDELELLKQRNMQLTEANQRWSNEWNKLQEHYEIRIADLQAERDQLAKEITELKITEEAKQRDFEKMLMNSKKKASDEENAKEDAFLQLTSVNNQLENLRMELLENKDRITALIREKQVLETELSVIRQTQLGAGTGTAGQAQGSRSTKSQTELKTENDVLRQQLIVFQEDFDRERQDRAKATTLKEEYKKQSEQYKKRARHIEQKNVSLDKQVRTLEESNKKLQNEKSALQQEISSLNIQLNREIEKNRNLVPSQVPFQPPLIQSAGLQPQRQMIFGQPRPQQYVVPSYDQPFRVPPLPGNGMNYVTPGSQYHPQQAAGFTPPGLYLANQSGRQTEYRPGAWSCTQCTYVNYPGRTVCEMCGYIQSTSTQTFNYRPLGSDTLHARGDLQRQHQQQGPFGGFAASTAAQHPVTADKNY